MGATDLFKFPEFTIAGILLVVTVLYLISSQTKMAWPAWLVRPAESVLLCTPAAYREWIVLNLLHAGWREGSSYGDFACLKFYLPLASLISTLVLAVPLAIVLAIVCFFSIDLVLLLIVKRRQQEIQQSLPQALDLMLLCVDAGLGLDATLQRIASENATLTGPLNEELNLLGHEILLGVDRESAYKQLYNRTNVDELKTLGSALFQASKLGLSISRILRAQSDFIRKRQSQKAEERAMRMPIYMAFPLWFFIMPSLMVLVLAPPLIKFYHQLHGSPF